MELEESIVANTNKAILNREEIPGNTQRLTMESMPAKSSTPNVPATLTNQKLELSALANIPVTLIFEVGQTNITIAELMKLCRGSFISLKHAAVDSIDVKVTGQVIATAETITMGKQYGIRISEIEVPMSLIPESPRDQ